NSPLGLNDLRFMPVMPGLGLPWQRPGLPLTTTGPGEDPEPKKGSADVAEVTQPSLANHPFFPMKEQLEAMPPAEASVQLFELPPQHRAVVFRLLSKDHAIAVFEMLEPHQQQALIE